MKVFLNIPLRGRTREWVVQGGRKLEIYNNTGQTGKRFERVWLGYKRIGRKHIITLSLDKKERWAQKQVGIWVSEEDYMVLTTGEIWTGKTSENHKIIGRFGIYNLGTVIKDQQGIVWELKRNKGWVIKSHSIRRTPNEE